MQIRIEDTEQSDAPLSAHIPGELIASGAVRDILSGTKKSFSGEPIEILTFAVGNLPEIALGMLSAALYDIVKRPFTKVSVEGKDIKKMTLAEIEDVLAKKTKSK